jgi:hypothetical protein
MGIFRFLGKKSSAFPVERENHTPETTPTPSGKALEILNAMPLDPNATHAYEHLSGGMLWSDEFPDVGSRDWEAVSVGFLYRFLIAARRDITIGAASPRFQELWRLVETHSPNWPGLRPERRSEGMRKRLLAAERLAKRCYEKTFDGEEQKVEE